MKAYIKTYLDYYEYAEQDVIPCENCKNPANDTHHIHLKGMGGSKTFIYKWKIYDIDDIINLIALCRDCHIKAHKRELTRDYLMLLHKIYMKQHGK